MTWLLVGLGVTGWVLALLLLLLLPRRAHRRAMNGALRVRSQVESYLRRRAAELGCAVDPAGPPPSSPDAVLDQVCDLAARLTRAEKSAVGYGDTLNLGISDTMPLAGNQVAQLGRSRKPS